jgi:prepilin-type N-terminal cleavage/methylation domain-containing protein
MKAKPDAKRAAYGVTLIETMVAVAIILVAVSGATFYQYYTVLDARKADLRMEAARLALTFLEGWKGAGCAMDFDPQTDFANGQSAEFTAALGVWGAGYGEPPLAMEVCKYAVTTEKNTYFMILSCTDESLTDNIPVAINAQVTWDSRGYGGSNAADAGSSLGLTTYGGP